MQHNIAIFIPSLKSGGAEKQAAILGNIISKRYDVHFIVFYGEMISERNINILTTSNAKLHLLNGSSIHKLIELFRILRTNSIDVAFNYLTYCDTIGAIIERLAGIKLIYNGIRNSRLPLCKFVAEWIAHNTIVSGTIFNCQSGYDYFTARGFSRKKSIVIYNCIPNIDKPIVRNNKSVKNILTIGRFTKQKDYKTAIATIALIATQRSDFHFTIAGQGAMEAKIRSWITEYDIEKITNIVTEGQNIPQLLETADIYLSTSIYEGTSNSIMEAMNKCLPIVATDVGDNALLIDNGISGFLHHKYDVIGIAVSLNELLDNHKMRTDFGIRGNKKLKEKYSKDRFIDKYMKLLG